MILIDTSSILFSMQYSKDIFAIAAAKFPHHLPIISAGVIDELKGISSRPTQKSKLARASLEMIKVKNIRVDNIRGSADAWMLEKARQPGRDVFITNDTALFKEIKSLRKHVLKISKNGILRD